LYDYVIENNGYTSDKLYPYISGASSTAANSINTCKSFKKRFGQIKSYKLVKALWSTTDTEWVKVVKKSLEEGPLAALVKATEVAFILYESGILEVTKTNDDVNHEVVIIGYGVTTDQTPKSYWIIRNSWGSDWGEKGDA